MDPEDVQQLLDDIRADPETAYILPKYTTFEDFNKLVDSIFGRIAEFYFMDTRCGRDRPMITKLLEEVKHYSGVDVSEIIIPEEK